MSRNVIIAIVAAIVIIVILFLIPWGGDEPVETGAVDVTEEVEEAGADVAETAEDAAGAVETETEEAAAEVEETTEGAETEEVADEPIETIEVEGEAEVVEPEEAEADAAGAEADAGAEVDAAGGAEGIAGATDASEIDPAAAEEVLSVEGFDYDSVVRIIELSEIPAEEQETLTADLEAAQDDEAALADALERIRTALEEAAG